MQKTLLLIEDDRNLLELNRKILTREGYNVHCSSSFAEARGIIEINRPDGIILNVEMTDGSGLDFCRELKERCRIPVLFLSGNADDELKALQAGGNDFIRQPYDFDILKARISVMLQSQNEIDREAAEK